MIKITRFAAIIVLLPLLVGCKEKNTYSYYMQHPAALKKAMVECESQVERSPAQATQCEAVMAAREKMISIINEWEADPEKFGQRVIEVQEHYAALKKAVMQAKEKLKELQGKQASAAEIKIAQDNLGKARKLCSEQAHEVKELLAVLGMSSPG